MEGQVWTQITIRNSPASLPTGKKEIRMPTRGFYWELPRFCAASCPGEWEMSKW